MTVPSITVEAAALVLRNEPQATNRAVEAAFTALNMANHIYNELPAFGPAQTFPDLDAELRGFKARMQGRDQAEGYILAVEAEKHFTTRLREAEAMRERAAKARYDFQSSLQLARVREGQERSWRDKHCRSIKATCCEHLNALNAIIGEVDNATTEENLNVAVGHLIALAADFHSCMETAKTMCSITEES